MTARIALMTDRRGWHTGQLCRAFDDHGWLTLPLSLRQCAIDLSAATAGLRLPGFEDRLPDAVFVRSVPGGSFEQVTFYLAILHRLTAAGVPVINNARGIEFSVDKGMTSLLLLEAGLPTPATWVCSDPDQARSIVRRELNDGRPLVQKPLFGSQGRGVRRLRDLVELHADDPYDGVYYLQRYIAPPPGGSRDWRVLVAAGTAVAAMSREGREWINNVAAGARCRSAVLAAEVLELAQRATQVLGLDYAGVDLLCDAAGRWWVLEVNSVPAWQGLQGVTSQSIAAHLTAVVAAALPQTIPRGVAQA